MKTRRSFKLHVEELENRLVPSTVNPVAPASPYALWGSSNWSGITLDTTTTKAVSAVSGSWAVSTATGTNVAYSATWVGIDGDVSNTVEQIGTESDTAAGAKGTYGAGVQYYAWFEMYPANSHEITIGTSITTGKSVAAKVEAGDQITASVTWLGTTGSGRRAEDNYRLTITDSTEGWTFTTTQNLGAGQIGARDSAEWVEEAPSGSRGVLPLANFGSVTFTNATATINGTTGTIGSFAGKPFIANYGTSTNWQGINLIDIGANNAGPYEGPATSTTQWSSVTDETSVLNSAGNSFSVGFGDSAASPPSNGTISHSTVKASDERIVDVLEFIVVSNQPTPVEVVTVSTSAGLVEVIILSVPLPMAGVYAPSAEPNFAENGLTSTPPAPPVIPNGNNPVVIRPTSQSEPSGFDGGAPGANENAPAFPMPPSEKMQDAPDSPWPSDSRYAAQPHGPVPVVGLFNDADARLTLPNPGPILTPVGPVASDAELDALFSNWQPTVDAPLASAGPRLESTDMLLATLALTGLVVWTQERRQQAEGTQPALRAP